jgi:RNA recognition motif-containing protein
MARLFVGNLSFDAGEHDLYALFAPYGHVRSAHLSCDRQDGQMGMVS